jgi:hypothetical protein
MIEVNVGSCVYCSEMQTRLVGYRVALVARATTLSLRARCAFSPPSHYELRIELPNSAYKLAFLRRFFCGDSALVGRGASTFSFYCPSVICSPILVILVGRQARRHRPILGGVALCPPV